MDIQTCMQRGGWGSPFRQDLVADGLRGERRTIEGLMPDDARGHVEQDRCEGSYTALLMHFVKHNEFFPHSRGLALSFGFNTD